MRDLVDAPPHGDGGSKDRQEPLFLTRPEHREEAMKEVASDLRRISRNGYSEESLTGLFENLIGGLCSFVYNCPLDMLIERRLREDSPALRPMMHSVGTFPP